MILRELFSSIRVNLLEGGNLSTATPGWIGAPGEHEANEIELKIHNRTYMAGLVNQLLHDINAGFHSQYKKPLWTPELLKKGTFLSGSSLHFFNVKGIPDEKFIQHKPKVGDIDTQINAENEKELEAYLRSVVGQQVGVAKFLGFKFGNSQLTSLWEFAEPPMKIQVDFEFGRYDPKTNEPDEWFAYSHSSDWDDVEAGIKGVFHKYLNRALTTISSSQKYVARVLKKSTKISPEPVTDNDLSFAVSGPSGGGMSRKYKPYVDPATGEPMVQNGLPVMQLLDPKDRDYIQNLGQQFELIYGRKPKAEDKKLMNSFVGTISLCNKYLSDEQRNTIANSFIGICFEPGSQMITKDDPARDREIKFAAIEHMVENLKLPNAEATKQYAIEMSQAYEADFKQRQANKAAKLNEDAKPAVVQSKRKGIVHLDKMKDIDFLDLLSDLQDETGQIKLHNIPMTVKVDGFGGRFGFDENGQAYAETSRSGPKFKSGEFMAYAKAKGVTDPDSLKKTQQFDDWFDQMLTVAKAVGDQIDLRDTKIHVEVLYLPFAEQQPDGRLKFVGIKYDPLPQGVTMALVPLFAEKSSTGEQHPQSNQIIKRVRALGRIGPSMFIDNSLTTRGEIDATAIVPPMENLETFRHMLLSKDKGINDRKREVSNALQPIKDELSKFIISHPDILGKDILGKDYEGIILNTRKGPVKITSPEQKQVIADKNAAIAAAGQARKAAGGAERTRTAVVTAGSFVGHIGHEQLVNLVLKKAEEVGGDPYVFISPVMGPDDPIPPAEKLKTWQKLYPQHADIFQVWQEGGTPIKKIEKELVLPPSSPYKHIILMVGTDRYEGMKKWMDTLSKRMKDPRYPGSHNDVTFETILTHRGAESGGTGVSFTDCRKALALPDDQALKFWTRAFDAKRLGTSWIKHLMKIARHNMGIKAPHEKPQQVQQLVPQEQPAMPQQPEKSPMAASVKEANLRARQLREGTINGSGIRATGVTKKIDPTQKAAMKNATTMPDLNQSSGSAYLGWRMGIALAGAPDYPTKAEADNWIGGDPLLSAYTEEEQEMIKAASLAVGGGRIENWSGKRSQELPDVNKTSVVAKPKRNKYGI